MGKLRYSISGGFSDEQLKGIHSQVLRILEEIGVELNHQGILKKISDYNGVRIKNTRICYEPWLVEKFIPQISKEDTNYATNNGEQKEFILRTPYMAENVTDVRSGKSRRSTLEDLKTAVKICDIYGVSGATPLEPDIDIRLRQIIIFKTCLENGREIGCWSMVKNCEEALYIREMGKIAGMRSPCVALQSTISPLKLDTHMFDIVFRLSEEKKSLDGITIGGGAMPLPGATAPMFVPAAFAQGMAEALAGWITAKLIDEKIQPYCSFIVYAPDLTRDVKGGERVPERFLYALLERQVMRYITGLSSCGSFRLEGRIILDALDGVRTFVDVGAWAGGFAYEQVVIDKEVIGAVAHLVKGVEIEEEENLTLSTIAEGVKGGTFLDHPYNINYRNIYWLPKIFKNISPGEWFWRNPQPEIREEARQIADREIAKHSFKLDKGQQEEINRIYKIASEKL